MKDRHVLWWLGVCFVGGILLAGCTVYRASWLYPQSHFDYPNSNVIPIGRAVGEAKTISVFVPVIHDPDVWEEAVMDAIRQKNGDLLIDFYLTIEVVKIPGLPFYEMTYIAEGTVAKMEIGKQTLH